MAGYVSLRARDATYGACGVMGVRRMRTTTVRATRCVSVCVSYVIVYCTMVYDGMIGMSTTTVPVRYVRRCMPVLVVDGMSNGRWWLRFKNDLSTVDDVLLHV